MSGANDGDRSVARQSVVSVCERHLCSCRNKRANAKRVVAAEMRHSDSGHWFAGHPCDQYDVRSARQSC
jgi:hypothetical protein